MKTKRFWQLCAAAGAVALFVTTAAAQSSAPVDPSEQKHAERIGAEAKELDAKAGKATPEGQRRVTDTIAKDFKVDPSVVTDLRNRKMGFGEITIALALSQELMKTNSALSQQDALGMILEKRAAGEGWGKIAHDLNLKLGHVRSKVEKAEKQVARVERSEKAEKAEKPEKVEKVEKMEKPEKPAKVERPGR
jgi:hypothetical protein